MAEERRLFYVAVTRAKRELRMTWAAERTFGAKASVGGRRRISTSWSRCFDALTACSAPAERRESWRCVRPPLGARGRTPRDRAGPPDIEPVDRPLFDELRTWRMQRAKAAGVPAFVIFDDKTLKALADPTTS